MPTVVVLAAHGSRAEAANTAHRVLADAVAAQSPVSVVPAFLELAEPSIPDAIDGAVYEGATSVLVLPYFLHPGRHLAVDLSGIVTRATDRHPGADVRLLDLFGADPALVALVVAQISRASARD